MLGAIAAGAPLSSLDTALAIELPAQPLGEALRGLAKQANLQILFEAGLVTGHPAPAIRGQVTARDALDVLLRDTGLEAYEQAPGVIVIKLHGADPTPED
jgi:hypothetical protein